MLNEDTMAAELMLASCGTGILVVYDYRHMLLTRFRIENE